MVITNAIPLLQTKVQPPERRPDGLRRPRLLDALLEHSNRKLLIVVAPAGYGKTTLLIDLAHEAPQTVAWLALDAADRDPSSFIEYLVHSLRRHYPAFGATVLAALAATPEIEAQSPALVRTFVAEVQQHVSNATLLVLDDFHEVNESKAVTAFLDDVLRLLPDNLRVVLASRTLPQFTVSRLAVQQELFGLGEAELRFTPTEVRGLFQLRHQLNLDEGRACALTDAAEGWITGLLLSMAGIWDGLVDQLVMTRGADGPLYDYLAGEVFDRQPADVRAFLLDTSVLRLMDQESCFALLGPGQWLEMLRRIEQANLFVTRIGGPVPTFHYHQLFRDFLQARLRREQPDRLLALHRRAARYYERQRDWSAAVEHYQSAGEQQACAALLERAAPELEAEGRWHLLARSIDALPEAVRNRSARIMLARARAASLTGDLNGAEALTRLALRACPAKWKAPSRAWLLQVRGNALRRLGRIDDACEALESARTLGAADEALIATIHRDLAGCYGVRGDLRAAITHLQAALAYFERSSSAYEAARAAFGLGAALGRIGDTDGAVGQYRYALARFRAVGDQGNVALTLNNLGYLCYLRGSISEARQLLDEALQAARAAGYPTAEAQTLDSLGALQLSSGDAEGATECFRRGLEIAQDAGDLWSVAATSEGLGYCALLQGDDTAAEAWFGRAAARAAELGSAYRTALAGIGRGVLALQGNSSERALEILLAASTTFARLGADRDAIRARFWLVHAYRRRGDLLAASTAFQAAAAEAEALQLPALADLPARWDSVAFAALTAGEYAAFQAGVLQRIHAASTATAADAMNHHSAPIQFAVYSFGAGHIVEPNGAVIEWPREKARELLFYLLHHGPTRSERLSAELWPESSSAQAKARLYTTAYALRRVTHTELLQAVGQIYSVNPQSILFHDAAEFDALAGRLGKVLDPDRRLAALEQLVRLYTAPFLDGVYAEWAEELRRAYESRYLAALQALVSERAAQGAWQTCLAAALDGIRTDPYCEAFYAYAARSHLALGNPEAARRMYREGRGRLTELLAH